MGGLDGEIPSCHSAHRLFPVFIVRVTGNLTVDSEQRQLSRRHQPEQQTRIRLPLMERIIVGYASSLGGATMPANQARDMTTPFKLKRAARVALSTEACCRSSRTACDAPRLDLSRPCLFPAVTPPTPKGSGPWRSEPHRQSWHCLAWQPRHAAISPQRTHRSGGGAVVAFVGAVSRDLVPAMQSSG